MQLLIGTFTLFICLAYVIRRIYIVITTKAGDPCCGCQLKQSCRKHRTKVNGAQAQRQNIQHHGRSNSPCNGCDLQDNSDTVRHDTPLSDRHNER